MVGSSAAPPSPFATAFAEAVAAGVPRPDEGPAVGESGRPDQPASPWPFDAPPRARMTAYAMLDAGDFRALADTLLASTADVLEKHARHYAFVAAHAALEELAGRYVQLLGRPPTTREQADDGIDGALAGMRLESLFRDQLAQTERRLALARWVVVETIAGLLGPDIDRLHDQRATAEERVAIARRVAAAVDGPDEQGPQGTRARIGALLEQAPFVLAGEYLGGLANEGRLDSAASVAELLSAVPGEA